jgi:transcriptional regulator with XRE-family HTH domain
MKQTYVPTETDRLTGLNVRQLRKRAGETLVETIERSGVGIKQSSLSRVELGQRQLSIPEATKLAAHWDTTVGKIIIEPNRPAQVPAWTPATEQDWLGNDPKPALFAVPETSPLHKLAGVGFGGVDLNANVVTIDRNAPMTPEQYRAEIWIPYLENRYATDQKAG